MQPVFVKSIVINKAGAEPNIVSHLANLIASIFTFASFNIEYVIILYNTIYRNM